MPIVADAAVAVRGDLSKFSQDLKQGEQQAKGLGDAVKVAMGAAVGAASGAAIGLLGEQIVTVGDSMALLQAQTGKTDAEMGGFEDRLKSMHANNFGTDYQDLARSLAAVEQQLGITGEEADHVTTAALSLRDAFGKDVTETLMGLRPLMQNFGIDGMAAMDLITVGLQESGGAGDDLLDTFQEYSGNFRDMGYTAEEFMAILVTGLENGVRNTDFLADAIKEFDIRIADGSATTRESFRQLGIDYDSFVNDLGTGAITGADALSMVNDGLRGIGNTAIQEQIGVGLYGTKWEDVGAQAILSIDQTDGRFQELADSVEGASDRMTDAVYSGPTSAFDAFTRSIVGTITEGLEPFTPALQAAAPLLAGFGPMLPMIVSGLGGMAGALATAASSAGLFSAAMLGPIGLIAAVGIAAVALDGFIDGALSELSDEMKTLADSTGEDMIAVEKHVGRMANELGISFDEAERRVRDYADQHGLSILDAVEATRYGAEAMSDAQWEMAEESRAAWDNLSGGIAAGAGGIDAAARDMADGIPQAMQDALDEGEEIARSTPGSLADELRAGIDDYDEALEELTEVAVNSVSDLAERQKIEGILASEELTDALNSDSLRTRLLAQELVADLVSDYELLAPGALAAGETVNPNLADGIYDNIGLATAAGEAVVDAAGNPLVDTGWAYEGGRNVGVAWANGLRSTKDWVNLVAWEVAAAADPALHGLSPPKEGPLRNIDEWGENIGRAWAEGLGAAAPWVAMQSRSLAGAAAGALTTGISPGVGAPMAGAVATPVGVGNTYIVNVNGVQRTVKSEEEAMQALRDLGAFDEGRLA